MNEQRTGPFWDALAGRVPPPPAAVTLGWQLVSVAPDKGENGPEEFAPTLELKVQFLRPAAPGPLLGRARVVHRGGGVAFLAGELCAEDGFPLATATATATARLVRRA